MKRLFLARYEQSVFGRLSEYALESMIQDAGKVGLHDIDRGLVDTIAIAGLLAPALNDQLLLAGLVAMDPAYRGKPIRGVANACDSGGLAILDCAISILAGQGHVGLAIGVEKMHPAEGKLDSKKVGAALGSAAHREDRFPPLSFPHVFALIMERYMKVHRYSEREFAVIPPLFYENASYNPAAHMYRTKSKITEEAVLASARLFEDPWLPLKLFESSQISDGWARILVCDEEGLHRLGIGLAGVTELVGFGQSTDPLAMSAQGEEILRPRGARQAFTMALDMAGITTDELGVAEVHDCFSVMAALSLEIIGLAREGEGLLYFLEGDAALDGRCPINTSGGLIAKGHPVSATGIAMVGWVHQQLLQKVPKELQVEGLRYGGTLNVGGPICSTVAMVQRAV